MNKNFYLCIVKKTIIFNNVPHLSLGQKDLSSWIYECATERCAKIKKLHISFITEDEMLSLNQKHMKHNDHTDIITFCYNNRFTIESEVFISFERACENAKKYSESIENEILRLISHGLLHIFGMKDNTKALKEAMTKEENNLIEKFHVKHRRNEKAL